MATVQRGSREYLTIPIALSGDEVPTTPTVHVAVMPRGSRPTSPSDWALATWVGAGARLLLTGALARGVYGVWIQITEGNEIIVRYAGTLNVM